jgi:hypothetical protein
LSEGHCDFCNTDFHDNLKRLFVMTEKVSRPAFALFVCENCQKRIGPSLFE